MKMFVRILAVSTILLGSGAVSGVAFAGSNDDVVARLNAAERDNAVMRNENAALAAAAAAKPASIDRMADFSGTYAADLPVAYKAPPLVEPGRLTLWGQGGAFWTGGDEVARSFSLTDFTMTTGEILEGVDGNNRSIPGIFDLNPKVGWQAATGFDYKFAASPWHVSGQFRYGQSGKASGTASSAGTVDPLILQIFGGDCSGFPGATVCGGSETFAASYKETHWLADLALGYDLAGRGPSTLQVKSGLRISEFVSQTNTTDQFSSFASFTPPLTISGISVGQITYTALTTENIRTNLLAAGPLIGLEGSARFLGSWSFDFKGDLAVLFGTQSSIFTTKNIETTTPAIAGLTETKGANFVNIDTDARFVTVLSPDIEVGVSYWFNPNMKLGVSYRVDALIAVKNQKSADADRLLLPQRYWHGPLVGFTGTF